MMPSDIRNYVDTVLSRIAQDSFGRRDAPQVRLSPDTREDGTGAMAGCLEVTIRTRKGERPIIQREPFEGLRTPEQVDDLFARALSVLLMNHTDWPR